MRAKRGRLAYFHLQFQHAKRCHVAKLLQCVEPFVHMEAPHTLVDRHANVVAVYGVHVLPLYDWPLFRHRYMVRVMLQAVR